MILDYYVEKNFNQKEIDKRRSQKQNNQFETAKLEA